MTNKKLFALFQTISTITDLKGVKFNYALAKNKAIIAKELEAIQEASKPSDDFTAFEKERVELCKKHAKKDEKEQPIVNGNEYVIENEKDFNKELETLKETHKESIENRQKQIDEFNTLLEKENPIELYKIDTADIPEDITTEQMTAIFDLIK